MGYYTRYELFVDGERAERPETVECDKCHGTGKVLSVASTIEKAYAELQELCDNYSPLDDKNKWYEHKEDMLKLSANMPDVLFELRGEGEESGDIWRKQFKGGKMLSEKKAKIVFD